jgi:hypothetical protein
VHAQTVLYPIFNIILQYSGPPLMQSPISVHASYACKLYVMVFELFISTGSSDIYSILDNR